ncbi:noncompact myelin-associated protein [Hoplias malabaricus]|uniref:noncompact myelin-associated protein n=1 Tax=Hoplias malabaricus TaxID=27720 RepID=UPI003463289E
MQASTAQPGPSFTTIIQNTPSTTKSTQEILIQSSGAMIAIIVIGVVIILTILLIILKTYNRRTHAARMLAGSSKKTRTNTLSMATHTNLAMSNVRATSGTGSIIQSAASSENGFHIPRVDMGNIDQIPIEQSSTTSGSTLVTIHDTPSVENT